MLTLFLFLQDLLPVYSYEEKALMAEILREDQLNEKREKARNEDMKLHDAKLRRMFQAAQAVAVRKERLVYIFIPYHILQHLIQLYTTLPYPNLSYLYFPNITNLSLTLPYIPFPRLHFFLFHWTTLSYTTLYYILLATLHYILIAFIWTSTREKLTLFSIS